MNQEKDPNLKWQKARCPICGRTYQYLPEYKPHTCSNWDCIHKYLHPELHRGKVE